MIPTTGAISAMRVARTAGHGPSAYGFLIKETKRIAEREAINAAHLHCITLGVNDAGVERQTLLKLAMRSMRGTRGVSDG